VESTRPPRSSSRLRALSGRSRYPPARSERPSAGGETILPRLSELLFLQAVRQYLDGLPPGTTGWLAGLRDRHIGEALRLMHAQPAERWTLDVLAREVGLSRSAFAERFAALIGVPPMHYLANWRLQARPRFAPAARPGSRRRRGEGRGACSGCSNARGHFRNAATILASAYFRWPPTASTLVISTPAATSSLSRSSTLVTSSGSHPRTGMVCPVISGK
jgi:hypothetical protein